MIVYRVNVGVMCLNAMVLRTTYAVAPVGEVLLGASWLALAAS